MKSFINLEDIVHLAELNSFNLVKENGQIPPTIVVFRNLTRQAGNFKHTEDTGDNLTDTVCLIDNDGVVTLQGRSYPHEKYQARQVAGTGKANYIASGYWPRAWVKGWHRGFKALVQHEAFTIWRSRDMELHVVDETPSDDFIMTGIVADNFHGYAPYSAGCVTVFGNMDPPSHDWAIAQEWIYGIHENDKYVGAMILANDDFAFERAALRLGSRGQKVAILQRLLARVLGGSLKPDGEFGPMTFDAVRKFQRAAGLPDTGIWLNSHWPKLENSSESKIA